MPAPMPERRAHPARRRRGTAPSTAAPRSAPIRGAVRILFLDVDATLTDGVIGFTRDSDFRNFYVRDGLALDWARDLGLLPVVISGRASQAVAARMTDLRLENYLGVRDKVAEAEKVLAREGARFGECAMVGDDLPDVPLCVGRDYLQTVCQVLAYYPNERVTHGCAGEVYACSLPTTPSGLNDLPCGLTRGAPGARTRWRSNPRPPRMPRA